MPDDDRKRRRLGDETKGRIADLASGWDAPGSGPASTAPDPDSSANAPRRGPKTIPPPLPGSAARRELDDVLFDVVDDLEEEEEEEKAEAAPPRGKLPTAPSPVPGKPVAARPAFDLEAALDLDDWDDPVEPKQESGTRARQPSSPRSGPTQTGTVDVSGVIPEKSLSPEPIVPVPTVDASNMLSKTPPPAVIDRGGALGTPTTPKIAPPPGPGAGGARPGPPPPPGAKLTGGTAAAAAAAPRTPTGATPTSAPERSAAAPAPSAGPLRPPPGRGQRAAVVIDEPAMPEDDPARAPTQLAVQGGALDASRAGLGLPEAPRPPAQERPAEAPRSETAAQVVRADSTGVDLPIHASERGDPTLGSDATEIHRPSGKAVASKGRLRTIAQLQRRRGVGGDLRYVLTAIFGIRRARRELAALEAKQATRQQSRRRHLTTLGRTAVTADGFDHPALARAREQLTGVEEERARSAVEVAAADSEQKRVTRDRDAKAKQHATDLAAIDAELAGIAKKLEPLEKEGAGVTRRAADLRDAMRQRDEKIAFTEASLSAAKNTPEDRVRIQAEIASLKADRASVQRDEPVLAAELDSLHPRIAALEASRADARQRRLDLEQAERDDQRRTEELLAAIGAKRKVVDRAAGDAEARRDKILFELGERLYVDRPASMSNELAPIDEIDVELGTGDRRSMELREILQSVDRWKIARGAALWLLLLGGLGAAFWLATSVL